MNKKLEKVKVFVKEHKVEIACAVGAAALGVVAKRKLSKVNYITQHFVDHDNIEVPEELVKYGVDKIEVPEELVKYGVDRIDNYNGTVELITSYADQDYKVAVEELGKFGEALCKIPDIKPENKAYVLINIAKEIDNN